MTNYPPFNLWVLKTGYVLAVRHEKGYFGDRIAKTQAAKGFSWKDAYFTHVEILGPEEWSVRVAPPAVAHSRQSF